MSRRTGKQQLMAEAIESLSAKLARSSKGKWAAARVEAVWPEVVGEQIAAHTAGAHLKGERLVVYVDSAMWANELQSMSEMFRVKMNEALGKEMVSSVRFTVSKTVSAIRTAEKASSAEGEVQKRERAVPSIPLAAIELEAVEASTRDIEDPELREAAVRATVKHLEWSKGIAATKVPQEPREGL